MKKKIIFLKTERTPGNSNSFSIGKIKSPFNSSDNMSVSIASVASSSMNILRYADSMNPNEQVFKIDFHKM